MTALEMTASQSGTHDKCISLSRVPEGNRREERPKETLRRVILKQLEKGGIDGHGLRQQRWRRTERAGKTLIN